MSSSITVMQWFANVGTVIIVSVSKYTLIFKHITQRFDKTAYKRHYTAVWSKEMHLMGKFSFIPNCVTILTVFSSEYRTLASFEIFNVGPSWGYSFK